MQENKFRNKNPDLTRKLALASLFGALYALLLVVFAPISVGVVQIRIADALLPMAILFGWPVAVGLALGAGVGNFAADTIAGFPSSSISLDMGIGSVANLIACLLAWQIGQRDWKIRARRVGCPLALVVETLVIGVIIGPYLAWVFGVPVLWEIGLILAGSIIAIDILGVLLLAALGQERMMSLFKSQGLIESRRESVLASS